MHRITGAVITNIQRLYASFWWLVLLRHQKAQVWLQLRNLGQDLFPLPHLRSGVTHIVVDFRFGLILGRGAVLRFSKIGHHKGQRSPNLCLFFKFLLILEACLLIGKPISTGEVFESLTSRCLFFPLPMPFVDRLCDFNFRLLLPIRIQLKTLEQVKVLKFNSLCFGGNGGSNHLCSLTLYVVVANVILTGITVQIE